MDTKFIIMGEEKPSMVNMVRFSLETTLIDKDKIIRNQQAEIHEMRFLFDQQDMLVRSQGEEIQRLRYQNSHLICKEEECHAEIRRLNHIISCMEKEIERKEVVLQTKRKEFYSLKQQITLFEK